MRKINYLMSMFAIVLMLGITSCDPNEGTVVPENSIENQLVGTYTITSSVYNGIETLPTNSNFEIGNDYAMSASHFNFLLNADGTGMYRQLSNTAISTTWSFDEPSMTIKMFVSVFYYMKIISITDTELKVDVNNGGVINTYIKS